LVDKDIIQYELFVQIRLNSSDLEIPKPVPAIWDLLPVRQLYVRRFQFRSAEVYILENDALRKEDLFYPAHAIFYDSPDISWMNVTAWELKVDDGTVRSLFHVSLACQNQLFVLLIEGEERMA